MRRLFIFLLSLLLCIGSTAVLIETLDVRETMTRGITNPITAEMLPYKSAFFGVNAELRAYDDDQLPQQLDMMRDAHITWVRQYIYWDIVEAERGIYDWSAYDKVVEAVSAADGLQLVAVLMNTPTWARDTEAINDPTSPPADPADFARFVTAFAQQYGDSVDFVQIWDEPNLYTNWGRIPPRAARYTALLTDAYHALHAADPQITVIAAALAPTIEHGPDNISELAFLRDMYIFGARDVMDAAAGKPYGFDFPPEDRRVHNRLLNFSRFAALREVMIEYGDASKQLWGSQWGWNSLPENWSGLPSIWGKVTQQEQIAYTLGALDRAEREWPWLGGLILHHWNPPYPIDYPQQGFTLTTPDGAPTALLTALRERDNVQHATNGWHAVRNPDARYSGVWTFSEAGADIGWLNDSRLTFTFTGTDVGLILRQDDYVAHLYVTVNGQPANALPIDAAGNAYLVLSSGLGLPEFGVVPVANNLPYGTHTLEVIADRGFDRYALAGFAVGTGDITGIYNAWVAGAGLALIASLFATVINGAMLPFQVWNEHFRRVFFALGLPLQIAISAVTSLALMTTFMMSLGGFEPPILRREPVLPLLAFLSAGAVYMNFALPLTILAALVLFWCIVHRISLGLMLIVFFAPFFLFPVELYKFRFPIVEVITLITFAAWMLNGLAAWGRLRKSGKTIPRPQLHLIDGLALTFLALSLAAVLWSTYKGVAITELRTMFVEPLMFYAVFRTTKLSDQERRLIILTLMAAGSAAAGISLLQYVRGDAIITAEDASRRLAGIYGSPNNLALFLGRCIPFALAAVMLAREKRTRIVAAAAGLVMLAAFLLTQSVGGIFIGLPAAAVIVFLAARGRRAIPVLLVLALLTVIGFALAASQSDRFARALDFTQGTNFYRVRVMQSALQVISRHPVTGLGLDQFLYAFRDTYIYPDAWPEPDLSHPHNFLLDFWVRLGLGGAILAIAFIFSGAKLSIRAIKTLRLQPFWSWVSVGLAGAFAYMLAHGLLDNSVFVIDLVYVFWALMALGISMSREETRPETSA